MKAAHVRWTKPIWSALGRLSKLESIDREASEDILRAIVLEVSGQTSTRKLTTTQARAVLTRLNEKVDDAERRQKAEAEAEKRRRDGPWETDGGVVEDYRPTTDRERAARPEDGQLMVTADQSKALIELAALLGWGRGELRGWIRGKMVNVCKGMPWPQTRDQAMRLHEGLEAMVMRRPENQPDAVLERVRRARRAPDLSPWEEGFLADLAVADEVLERWNKRETMRYRSWKRLVKLHEIETKRDVEALDDEATREALSTLHEGANEGGRP